MNSSTRLALSLAAALLVALPLFGQTNVYKWTDKDGKVHFTDTPPPEDAKGVTQKRLGGGQVDEGQLPFATQQAMRKNPVTLYTSNSCGDICASGRDLLGKRGIPYAEKNAEANRADAEQVRKLTGALEVPVLVIGETPIKGYSESTWDTALDGAGYPRTKLPGQVGPRTPAPAPVPPQAPAQPETPR